MLGHQGVAGRHEVSVATGGWNDEGQCEAELCRKVQRTSRHHVQLVSDETFTAAKKKTKEERQRTIQETMGSKPTAAQALVALVMSENVTGANVRNFFMDTVNNTITVEPYGMSLGKMVLVTTILVIFIFAMFWHRDFRYTRYRRFRMFVRNCFYMKKIPQRRLEKKIKDLETEIENY
jgi:uncharacterized membrane protein